MANHITHQLVPHEATGLSAFPTCYGANWQSTTGRLPLAPMEDVSDPPFRALCKEKGAVLMYTEFISAEGLIRDAARSVQKLDIYDYEQPMGILSYGEKIESMREAAAIAEASQPALIDINYGCPAK